MNQFGKFAEKIGILVQGGTVNVGQIRLDSEMSRQELRNRKALLNNVRTAWVEGVLEKSLHEQIPIVLGLENRPSAVASPWNLDLINLDKSCQPLSAGTPVIDVFDKLGEGGTLLILGEPGSGKTITLLQLARDLIARAIEEIDHRIPVVLNLSSWAAEKQTIAKWIVEELNSKYQLNRKIGQQWVEKQELLLLLDGLDEIRDLEKRNACVTALNAFQQEQATEMVVCCRARDYEELGNGRLKLQFALVLEPLTTDQIHTYLDRLQSNLTVLKKLLIEDVTLQELSHSPLLLNIMVIAYQGIEVADMPVGKIASNRKKQLFDDYINRIFQGSRLLAYSPNLKSTEKHFYARSDVTSWLIWLARQIESSDTIFLVEEIKPNYSPFNLGWINNKAEYTLYQIAISLVGGIIMGLIGWLIGGGNYGLVWGMSTGIILSLSICNSGSNEYALISGLIFSVSGGFIFGILGSGLGGITFGVIFGMMFRLDNLRNLVIGNLLLCCGFGLSFWLSFWLIGWLNLGIIAWMLGGVLCGFILVIILGITVILWSKVEGGFSIGSEGLLAFGAIGGLVIGMIYGLIGLLSNGVVNYLSIGLAGGISIGIILGCFGSIRLKSGETLYSDQRIIKFFTNALIASLIGGSFWGFIGGQTLALTFGLVFGLVFGGRQCVIGYALRLILYLKKCIPWNYAKFLDWASDKLFLQKVGGGYIFIHRSLMEHFAEMENG